jgi:adenylate cyclase
MAEATPKWSAGRRAFGIYELLLSWWQHRVSFLISLGITFLALVVYFFSFFGESPTPILGFLQRLENSSLDMRFVYRPPGATPIDPRIAIVDIDQHTQEVLGKWPFSRAHFAHLLDALQEGKAKVAAFDVTFSKPDQTAAPLRSLWADMEEQQKRGVPADPKLMKELQRRIGEYDADKQFARSIQQFGAVVLGNFFLHTEADMRGMDEKTLDDYANQIAFYSFPSVRPLNPGTGKADRIRLIEKFRPDRLLPKGTEANIAVLTSALSAETSSTGFFNVYSDDDGVIRRSNLIIPYGRSKDLTEWDIYASLEVQTIRSFLDLPNEQVILEFGQIGASRIVFGDVASVHTDELGRVYVNYHGPSYTYPHYSMADVIERKVPPATFAGKIVLIGATATGIGDLRTTPFGSHDYPGFPADLVFRNPVWNLAGAGVATLDVVRVWDAGPAGRDRLPRVSEGMVAELHDSGVDADIERYSHLVVPGAGGRERETPGAYGVWAISEPGGGAAAVGESATGGAAQDGNHRDVQRHSRVYNHF